MELFDTHCHIHEIVRAATPVHDKWISAGITDADALWAEAQAGSVAQAICVGTTLADSELAVEFVQNHPDLYASIGIHPHETKDHKTSEKQQQFRDLATKNKVVAIGECGLDYFYNHSPKEDQIEVLRFQLAVAKEHNLPVIFHVREAFADFWPIFDEFSSQNKPVRGVIHSFTANSEVLTQALSRGLYIGLNGIMTFTKDENQLAAAKAVPVDKLLLETDAPFLTPKPYRGTINRLQYVAETAEFLANLRGETLTELASASTANARRLFTL
jgi:TatD DNase family protein